MAKTYAEAIKLLSTRSREWSHKSKPDPSHVTRPNNFYMWEWLRQLGHDLCRFDVIHVTGTKGKGSTCAFTESLLRSHFRRTAAAIKIGLYTSPHLHTERERIRINFQPVTEDIFTKYFFQIWDALHQVPTPFQPGYLQLLALLSVHIFRNEGVDIAIYEVHAGGRFDATNIFEKPVACGITPIGLDHVPLLGRNVRDIAWHKSGIMKPGSPAFSVPQVGDVRTVLEDEAKKIGSPLSFVGAVNSPNIVRPFVGAELTNLSLAIKLANTYLSNLSQNLSDDDISSGIDQYRWPGRFQLFELGTDRWYLDIAHNEMSIPVALSWFRDLTRQHEAVAGRCLRILVFGSPVGRDAAKLTAVIVQFCEDHEFFFETVIFTAYERRVDGGKVFDQEAAQAHKQAWRNASNPPRIVVSASVADALEAARRPGMQALIFGSSHLVSNALSLIGGES